MAPDIVAALKEHQSDRVGLLKRNRRLEVHSFVLRDETGQTITLKAPHISLVSSFNNPQLTGQLRKFSLDE